MTTLEHRVASLRERLTDRACPHCQNFAWHDGQMPERGHHPACPSLGAHPLGAVGLGAQIPMTPTPMSSAQALGALLAAGCPPGALRMVAAQSAVETAGWGTHGAGGTTGQGFNNFNFGNLTATPAQIAAGAAWMAQGKTMLHFLAFSDAVSGAKAMLAWLSARGLLPYAAAGDLPGYMKLLQAKCYLGCLGKTAPNGHVVSQSDYDSYQAGIASWMSKLSGVTPAPPPPPAAPAPWALPWGQILLGVGIVGLGTWGVIEARRWRLSKHLAALGRRGSLTA